VISLCLSNVEHHWLDLTFWMITTYYLFISMVSAPAHLARSSLAAGSMADHVQDSSSGLQVSAQHGSTVPSDILWADVNSCQSASSIHSLRPTDCSMHQNKLQQPQFHRPRTSCMEQSSCCTASTRHYTDNVQEQTEDILFQRVTVHTVHLQPSSDFVLYKYS